ncbi:MAG TPA: beta-propeller domain-containing protein, partial [Myxococcales bacterium]
MLRSPLFIALALAASCGTQPQPARIAKDPSLHAVQGCPAVEKAVQDAAVAQMRHQLEAQIMWRRLWGGGGIGVANGGPATGAGPASSGSSSSSPSAWTTTNTQVAGVDEPDFVKNDATHIFVLSGRKLFSAASWPPQQLGLGPSLSIEGYPIEMFLDEKSRIAVISQVPPADGPMVGAGMCPVGMGVSCGFYGPTTTKLSLVDSALHLTGELYL